MLKILLPAALLLMPLPALAKTYTVDAAKSTINFTVSYNGKPVTGTFGKWESKIDFDAANLPASTIGATIYTGSAHTGESIYDGTLPSSDWLDAEHSPKASFTSTSIEKKADGQFVAHGNLILKGKSLPVDLPFTLTPADGGGESVTAKGEFIVDRVAANVGLSSDPKAQWVSKDVKIAVQIVAK